jgi:hypothetical protein
VNLLVPKQVIVILVQGFTIMGSIANSVIVSGVDIVAIDNAEVLSYCFLKQRSDVIGSFKGVVRIHSKYIIGLELGLVKVSGGSKIVNPVKVRELCSVVSADFLQLFPFARMSDGDMNDVKELAVLP